MPAGLAALGVGRQEHQTRAILSRLRQPRNQARVASRQLDIRCNRRSNDLDVLDEKISITENGQPKIISKGRGMVKALTAKAMKGDVRAIATALGLVERLLLPAEAADKATPLAEADDMILALFAAKKDSKDQR